MPGTIRSVSRLTSAVCAAGLAVGGASAQALDFQQLGSPYVKDHLRLQAHPAPSGPAQPGPDRGDGVGTRTTTPWRG